jgi:hypothetical protein
MKCLILLTIIGFLNLSFINVGLAQTEKTTIATKSGLLRPVMGADIRQTLSSKLNGGHASLEELRRRLAILQSEEGKNSLRVIEGVTNWVWNIGEVGGKVLEVTSDGILLNLYSSKDVWLTNYSKEVVDNQHIGCNAKAIGIYSYNTVLGGIRTVQKYDCGVPVQLSGEFLEEAIEQLQASIATETIAIKDQLAADAMAKAEAKEKIKQKAAEAKKVAAEKILKLNQDQADKGDAYGLLRMGEHYRDGDGVEKNLTKAKAYFQKAVDAGSPSAADELKQLDGALK